MLSDEECELMETEYYEDIEEVQKVLQQDEQFPLEDGPN